MEDTVTTTHPTPDRIRISGAIAAVGLTGLAGFQLLLAAGVPWGRAAWGGAHDVLPPDRRVASGVAAGVWLGAALIVLGRAGYWGSAGLSGPLHQGTRVVVVLLLLGVVVNAASSSPWERFGWAPFALVLAALTGHVARGPREVSQVSRPLGRTSGPRAPGVP
jgi:hypothetical protein